jgi:hypothetical protein
MMTRSNGIAVVSATNFIGNATRGLSDGKGGEVKHDIEVRMMADSAWLFVNGFGIATWPSGAAHEAPTEYAYEVARYLRNALEAGERAVSLTSGRWGVFDTWQRRWCPRRGTETEMGAHAVKLNREAGGAHGVTVAKGADGDLTDSTVYRFQSLPLPAFDERRARNERSEDDRDRLIDVLRVQVSYLEGEMDQLHENVRAARGGTKEKTMASTRAIGTKGGDP